MNKANGTATLVTSEQLANSERAMGRAVNGELLPRAEWETLDIGGYRPGKRLSQIANAVRFRLCSNALYIIPPEWIREYNELLHFIQQDDSQ